MQRPILDWYLSHSGPAIKQSHVGLMVSVDTWCGINQESSNELLLKGSQPGIEIQLEFLCSAIHFLRATSSVWDWG